MKRLFFAFMLLFSCDPSPQFPKLKIRDAAADVAFCEAAASNLTKLSCEQGKPTKKGKTFGTLCVDLSMNGMFIDAKCISTVQDCEAVDVCTGSKL